MTTVINGTSTSASAPAVVGDDSNSGVYFPSSDQVAIATNGTQRLFIDSGGNAVLGTADPGNWSVGPSLTIRNKGNAIFNNGTSDLWMVANGLYDGGWSRAGADVVSGLELAGGGAYIYAADTGSAGSAFSFTQILNLSKGKTLSLEGASSQTGTGITFPASQNASSNANTLDDYEEGTFNFNPFFITGQSGSFTSSRNTGYYVKIGRVVHIQGWVAWSAIPAAGTTFAINLPFTSISGDDPRGGFAITYSDGFVATGYQIAARTENSASYCILNRSTSTSLAVNSAFNQGDLSTSSSFMISGSYITNA